MTKRTVVRTAATGTLAAALIGLAPQAALAATAPAPPPAPARASIAAAHDAAAAPATLDTLARFFASDGAGGGRARAAAPAAEPAAPRIEGAAVPVYVLSPDFVRGKADAPVARLEFLASKAVAADGRKASVWTVQRGAAWKVVNIASGDDETRYAAAGAAKAGTGGTVFREPQINAWYVQRGDRVEPLDAAAEQAVGAAGTTVAAYQKRVAKAYGDKLPGSAYDKRGEAGGYGPQTAPRAAGAEAGAHEQTVAAGTDTAGDSPVTTASAVAGAAALAALGLSGAVALRRRRRS
ncbi:MULTISPECIES: hypothetical protein [Streptomyces]|uniref:hypothetical protein n=1 Tax=Streptomyces TaxID=1883 RepID=UPI00069A293D|nr:hypothetical protein [Streptomyces sp. SID7805]MYU56926.1 hypothetical protein [Streptomyces sp. SID7805]